MKRIFLVLVLIGSVLFLSGCVGSEKSADISWENVKITVSEYAKVPTDVATEKVSYTTASQLIGGNQKTEVIEKPYRVVKLTISGNPTDHFYGSQAIGLISIYDEDGSPCSSLHPIKGMRDDVLVKGKIELIGLITCKNSDAKKSQFIFRESTTSGLDTVGDKFYVDLKEEPSEDTLKAIKEWKSLHQ